MDPKRSETMPTRNHHHEKPGARDVNTGADASSFAGDTADTANRLGAFLEDKAEQATRKVGEGMQSLGGAIHEHEPDQGVLRNAGEAVAGKLERGGRYLETRGATGVAEDVTNLIRRNPIPALLIGVGVGLLVARMLKRS
jgi:hypothetical protein